MEPNPLSQQPQSGTPRQKQYKKKLLRRGSEFVVAYTLDRINQILEKRHVVSYKEFLFNISEAGPGRWRLDPLSLAIIRNSSGFRNKIAGFEFHYYNGMEFFAPKGMSEKIVKQIMKKKFKIISDVLALAKSRRVFNELHKVLKNKLKQAATLSLLQSNHKEGYSDYKILDQQNRTFYLRICNRADWIYPWDSILWSFYYKAFKDGVTPILIAPFIHGSCFPLIKHFGAFARETWYSMLPEDAKVISFIEYQDNEAKHKIPISFGKFSKASNTPIPNYIESFLLETVPKRYDKALVRFKKISPHVLKRLEGNFKKLKDDPENENDPIKRIHQNFVTISYFLDALKLKELYGALREQVQLFNDVSGFWTSPYVPKKKKVKELREF